MLLVAGQLFGPGARGIVARSPGIPGVRGDPGRRVDSRLQTHRVNFITKLFHVGKLAVSLKTAVMAHTRALPGVVDVHVGPAVVDQTRRNHGSRRFEHFFLVHRTCPAIPAIPAHGRSQGELVADHDTQLLGGGTPGVAGVELDREHSLGFELSGNLAGVSIERQTLRQAAGAILHRPFARGRDSVQKRRSRACPEDAWSLDARLRRGDGSQRGRKIAPRQTNHTTRKWQPQARRKRIAVACPGSWSASGSRSLYKARDDAQRGALAPVSCKSISPTSMY